MTRRNDERHRPFRRVRGGNKQEVHTYMHNNSLALFSGRNFSISLECCFEVAAHITFKIYTQSVNSMKKPRRIAFSWLILWVAFAHLLFLSPTTALPSAECNICGCADCTMGNPRGLVTYTYGDGSVTSECQALQLQVYGDPLWGCGNAELWERAVEPCVCQNAEGVLLASNTGR